jgi:hypothetical protein
MANDTKLANEICWLTLAYPLDTIPVEVLKVLEQRHPNPLEKLRDLHYRIQPAIPTLRYQLEFTPVDDSHVQLPQVTTSTRMKYQPREDWRWKE